MEIIKNPNCRKVRGSHILEVVCGHCKTFIANYQKVGLFRPLSTKRKV